MLACAARGIRMFIVDWRGVGVVALSGLHQHAVVNIREAQFQAIHSSQGRIIAAEMIVAKIRNQRTVLLYFGSTSIRVLRRRRKTERSCRHHS